MAQERPEALVVHPSAAVTPEDRRRVFEFAVQRRLPAIGRDPNFPVGM
jgi:hypothetical protein